MDSAVCGEKPSSSAGKVCRPKHKRYVLRTSQTYGVLWKPNWRTVERSLVEVGIWEVKEAFSSSPGVKGGLGSRKGPELFSTAVSLQYPSGVRGVMLIYDSEGYGCKSLM